MNFTKHQKPVNKKKQNMAGKFFCAVLALILLVAVPQPGKGQSKQTDHIEQVWAGYFNQARFSKNWGTWTDLQLRSKEDFVQDFSQGIARFGITYYIRNTTKLTAGYAYIHHFPSDNHKDVAQPEHRPWQQVQWHTNYGRKKMMQWFRLEERYRRKILNDSTLASGYNFNFRLRYNFFYEVPLTSKGIVPGQFSFVVNDELHLNFGKQILYNYFDQNRFFLGFKYQLTQHDNIQLGYMNVFQQLPAGSRFRNSNVIRLFYFQNLDLRKEDKK
jgi:hypothetical protein